MTAVEASPDASGMTEPFVESATTAEQDAVVATLALAFATDPATRWTWPEPKAYLAAFPRFAVAFGGAAFARGTAHRIGFAAAALWLPPGASSDDAAIMALMMETAHEQTAADGPRVMQAMESFHPEGPHWYLPLIGIDPARQGEGLGGALLRHAAALSDRDGVPAYLESSNPRNVSLYRRHGFEPLGEIQFGNSPLFTPMLRKPGGR